MTRTHHKIAAAFGLITSLSMAAAAAALLNADNIVDVVRASTAQYRDPSAASDAGWQSAQSCVSGPQEGAMGVHFINGPLVGDGGLDATAPEALVYEPLRNGRMRLVAVEFIVPADLWNANHATPPVLLGQHFHLVNGPNRYGPGAFYELHVWAWQHNPSGMFADWNPTVTCDEYSTVEHVESSHAH